MGAAANPAEVPTADSAFLALAVWVDVGRHIRPKD